MSDYPLYSYVSSALCELGDAIHDLEIIISRLDDDNAKSLVECLKNDIDSVYEKLYTISL